MKKDFQFYRKLFFATFTISAFTFGGGYVIISLLKKKFVDEYHWIKEDEIMDLTAIAQASPGAMAVNAAIIIGYRLDRIKGALIAVLATVLPPFITLSIISTVYAAFESNHLIQLILRAMQAGVAAVIMDVVLTMGYGILKNKKPLGIGIMIGAFIAASLFHVNVILVIAICILIGIIWAILKERRRNL